MIYLEADASYLDHNYLPSLIFQKKRKRKKKADNLEPWIPCQVFWIKVFYWKILNRNKIIYLKKFYSKPVGPA